MPLTPTEWSALLLLATATSFTPGPNTTLSTTLAANGGWRAAARFIAAVPVGWTLLLTLCTAGVGEALVRWPALRWAVTGLGLAYLLWLALKLWRTPAQALASTAPARMRGGFVQGVALQFVNIKAWMLALALVGSFLGGHADVWARWLQVAPVMASFGLCSNTTYALIGLTLRRWLSGPVVQGVPTGQRLQRFNQAMGTVLAGTALWMAWSAVHAAA